MFLAGVLACFKFERDVLVLDFFEGFAYRLLDVGCIVT